MTSFLISLSCSNEDDVHTSYFERQGGKAFLIIHFTSEQKFYYLHIRQLLRFWNRAQEGGRKSFRMDELDPAYFFESSKGYLVPFLEPLSLDLEQEEER